MANSRKKMWFLRLVVAERDEDSGRRRGVFGVAYGLLRSGQLARSEHDQLETLTRWFEENLPLPDRSKLSPTAVFWFKTNARKLIRRIWDLVAILKENCVEVELVKTSRPGYIVYEDRYQVAAIPFKDTF
jgi:hypothetical protein